MKVLQRLVGTAEEDNEKFLLKLRERIDRFEHLNVEAEAHVGSRALPTFFNFIVNIVEDDIAFSGRVTYNGHEMNE
ncbi:Pleiotropic drug resistance protein [Arachis hypogaea]|nr:Pleiotropic drug resistance protein [Arachis hypogaea]